MVFAIALAFCAWDGRHAIEFVGLKNFVKLFTTDKIFQAALKNTIVYVIGTVPLTLACSLAMAVLLNQNVKLRNFFRTVAFFPYVASLVAVAAVWNMIFNPSMGPINMILNQFFGVAVENLPRWAAGKDTAMITVILFSVWKNMGYYMVIYLAGLQGCNPDLNEAAELDGANRWQQFWHITLPQLRPTTFFVVIMLTISGFKVYDQMYMITQGGPGTATMTLVYYIYNVPRQYPEIRLRKCNFHGAVRTGADRYHHPVPRLQGRELRKEEEPCLLLLSRPRPLRSAAISSPSS